MVILQLVPTIVEVSLLMGVLLWQFDWRYVLATLITVVVFMYLHLSSRPNGGSEFAAR